MYIKECVVVEVHTVPCSYIYITFGMHARLLICMRAGVGESWWWRGCVCETHTRDMRDRVHAQTRHN